MAKFRRIVASEEKVLEGLYREWTEVQKEIKAMATEALGSEQLESLVRGELKEGFVTKEQEKRAEELEGVRRKFMGDVERASTDAVERVRLEEKVSSLLLLRVCAGFGGELLICEWGLGNEDPG